MRVLLVDDSPVMRRYVARTLGMTGIDVTIDEAGDGREAIAKACAARPDLIVTDLNMPEMTGEQLVAEVTRNPLLAGTPILVLSSDRSAQRPRELLHGGATAYLAKPVSPEKLRESLLRIMQDRTPANTTPSREIICDSIGEVFETMYFCEGAWAGAGRIESAAIGAGVRFSDEHGARGEFRIVAARHLAARMAADFLAAGTEEISPAEIDAMILELANVACGVTLSAWQPESNFHLSVPRALSDAETADEWPHRFTVAGAADFAVSVSSSSASSRRSEPPVSESSSPPPATHAAGWPAHD